jgi:hypothetical protein
MFRAGLVADATPCFLVSGISGAFSDTRSIRGTDARSGRGTGVQAPLPLPLLGSLGRDAEVAEAAGGAEEQLLLKGGGLMGPLVDAATPDPLVKSRSRRTRWLGSSSDVAITRGGPWGIILACMCR